jgi:hypothetical protein
LLKGEEPDKNEEAIIFEITEGSFKKNAKKNNTDK